MSTYLIQVEKIQNFWRRNRKEKNRLGRKLDRLIGTEKKISSKQHLRRDIDRQIGRHIDRHTDRPIYIQIDRYIDWQKDRCTDRLIQREIERYIDKLIDGYIERGDEMGVCVCEREREREREEGCVWCQRLSCKFAYIKRRRPYLKQQQS